MKTEWQPIETAPKDGRLMFVACAFNVYRFGCSGYTSDPYCVFNDGYGRLMRWPHKFDPTHWMPLPPPPAP